MRILKPNESSETVTQPFMITMTITFDHNDNNFTEPIFLMVEKVNNSYHLLSSAHKKLMNFVIVLCLSLSKNFSFLLLFSPF